MQKTALKSILRKSILLAMLPIQAMALGLGDIEISSRLNQPLAAKVKLLSVSESDAKDLIVSLASSAAFIRAGIDRPFFLTKLRFKVVSNSDGSQAIQVTSRRPVVEPFLNFLVEVDWPKGRLLREYTILLDPPIIISEAANAPEETPQPTLDRFSATDNVVQPKPTFKPAVKELPKETPKPRFVDERTPSRFESADDEDRLEDSGLINRSKPAEVNGDGEQVEESDAKRSKINSDESAVSKQEDASKADARNAVTGIDKGLFDTPPARTSFSDALAGDVVSTNQIPKRRQPVPASPDDLDENTSAFTEIERKPLNVSVNKNDTLWSIAKNNKPKGTTIHQMMLSLLRYNPEAFINGNINRMRAGVVLRVPDKESIVSIDQATAVSIVKEQNALYQQYFAKIQGLAPVGKVKKATKPSVNNKDSNEVFVKTKNELEILKAENDKSISPEKSGKDAVKATGNIKKQILLAEEELLSEEQNQNDLRSEMDELLAINTKMDRLIDLKINQLSNLQNRLSNDDEYDVFEENETIAEEVVAEEVVAEEVVAEEVVAEEVVAEEVVAEEVVSEEVVSEEVVSEEVVSEEVVAEEVVAEEVVAEEVVAEEVVAEEVVAEEVIAEEVVAEEVVATEKVTPNRLPSLNVTKPKGMLERLLTLTNIGALLALLAVIGGAVFYIRKKKSMALDDNSVDDDIDIEGSISDEQNDATSADLTEKEELDDALSDLMDEEVDDETDFDTTNIDSTDVDVFEEEDAQELEEELEEDLESDEKDDVIAEADVYLAYGLYPQAEDLLNDALKDHPTKVSYIEKLLETHFAAKNVDAFQTQSEAFKKIAKVDGSPAWLRVVAMGKDLCPSYALFSQESDVAVDISDITANKPSGPDLDLDDSSTDIDLDFGDEDENDEKELDFDINTDTDVEINDDAFAETLITSAAAEIDMNETVVMLNSNDDFEEDSNSEIPDLDVSEKGVNTSDLDDMSLDFDIDADASGAEEGQAVNTADMDDMSLDFDIDADASSEESKEESISDALDFGDENSLEFDLGAFDDDVESEPQTEVNADDLDVVFGEEEQDEMDQLQVEIGDDIDIEMFSDDVETSSATEEAEKEPDITNNTAANNNEIDELLDESFDFDIEGSVSESLEDDVETGMETIVELEPETIDLDDMVDDTDSGIDALDSTQFNLTDLDELMEEEEAEAEKEPEETYEETVISSSESFEIPTDNTSDELDTMIELAIAYIDMGDSESAVSALEEIIETGNEEQKAKAYDLLSKVK